jgi:hypothetical protein
VSDQGVPSVNPSLPNAGLPTGNAPSLNDNLSKVPTVDGVPDLKQAGLPSTDLPDLKQDLPTNDLGKLPSTSDLNADQLKDLQPDVKAVTEKIDGLEKQTVEIQKASESANMEALEKEASSRMENVAEVKELAGGMTKAKKMQADHEAMIKRYQDQKKAYEEIKRKGASIANEKLEKNPEVFKDAQEKLSSAKKTKEKAKKFDLLKLSSDEFEGKKFYHRLVPGVTFQMHNQNNFSADLGVQLGYRFTPALTVGLGGTYRAYFDKSYDYFVSGAGVYGGRIYTSLVATKGFYIHAEFESLTLNPARYRDPVKADMSSRHFYGTNFGLGKRFNMSRKVKGTVLGLYRLEHEGYLPATQKVAVRMGFEYVIRKEKKLLPKGKRSRLTDHSSQTGD